MDKVELRERGVNYIQVAKNVVESYPLGIAHGLQKDAIQNAWDAANHTTPSYIKSSWKVEIKLLSASGRRLLTIQDYGTKGLSGEMTANDVRPDTIPPKDERWARWEMYAAGKSDTTSLGERGQGKMLLISSSSNYEIFYESLRNDGTYRMGWTKASTTGCPLYSVDNDAGRVRLKEELGIEPLRDQGTRFIIVDPRSEVVDSIINGEMIKYIEETWWPIILKYGASISVDYDDQASIARVPDLYPILRDAKETSDYKVWAKDNISLNFNRNTYKIKHLRFAFNKNGVDELNRGIAVFRAGMKVSTVEFSTRSYRDKVFGYVEFDNELDSKIKEIEQPNHYQFRYEGVWKKVKDIIEEELEAFGQQKLGLGIDARTKENQKRTAAHTKALEILRNITKDWPFANTSGGAGGGEGGSGPKPIKTVGIQLNGVVFPNDANIPRLNYGDELSGFSVKIFNRSAQKVHLKYSANVLAGDTSIINLDSKLIVLDTSSDLIPEDEYAFAVNKDTFPEPGEYRIKFSINDQLSEQKTILDSLTRHFWVEAEPRLSGPFEIKEIDFSEIPDSPVPVKAEWYLYPQGSGKWILYINNGHPSYMENDETEARQTRYLSEIYCMAALKLLFGQVVNGEIDSKLESQNLPFHTDLILSKDPREVYQELAWAISAVRFNIDRRY